MVQHIIAQSKNYKLRNLTIHFSRQDLFMKDPFKLFTRSHFICKNVHSVYRRKWI